MTLDEANFLIRATVDQMNARYTKTVFNEWALLSLNEKAGRILGYSGPRKEDFQKNFSSDHPRRYSSYGIFQRRRRQQIFFS